MTTSIRHDEMHPRDAARLLGSLIVPRPIAWISTINSDGTPNLAPFSFFNEVSANPPTVMISIGQRRDGTPKHSLQNIQENCQFVVNLVSENLVEVMNITSRDYDEGVSEFAEAGVSAAKSLEVAPPRVAEAVAAMECRATQIIPVEGSAYTLVLGQVIRYHLQDDLVNAEGLADPHVLKPVARLGGAQYTSLGRVFDLSRD